MKIKDPRMKWNWFLISHYQISNRGKPVEVENNFWLSMVDTAAESNKAKISQTFFSTFFIMNYIIVWRDFVIYQREVICWRLLPLLIISQSANNFLLLFKSLHNIIKKFFRFSHKNFSMLFCFFLSLYWVYTTLMTWDIEMRRENESFFYQYNITTAN